MLKTIWLKKEITLKTNMLKDFEQRKRMRVYEYQKSSELRNEILKKII
jgi:hypothetical protein